MPESGCVRVVVADDHLAHTMRGSAGLEVVAECADLAGALAAIRELRPDVAVLDVAEGLGVLEALAGDEDRPRVLLLSERPDGDVVASALIADAAGFLSRDSGPEEMCAAVAAVGDGERPSLTEREHEVLRLTAEGHSAPELARLLFVSPGTVKTHLRSIYDKLGVSEHAAAVAEAMRRGLLR